MPLPIAGPLSSDVPVRTIDRDELQQRLAAGDPRFKLVMTLGDWEFRAKHIPGSLHFKDAQEMLSARGLPLAHGDTEAMEVARRQK
jgi:hypothetical protein